MRGRSRPLRNSIRDQFDRSSADSLPKLKELAADAKALEKQPAKSLLLLSQMLSEADDPRTTAAVLLVASRRFPRDFWVCMLHGSIWLDMSPKPDPAEAVHFYALAVQLRPRSVAAHTDFASALPAAEKIRRGDGRDPGGDRAQAQNRGCSGCRWVCARGSRKAR